MAVKRKIEVTDGPNLLTALRQHAAECAKNVPTCRECSLNAVAQNALRLRQWCDIAQEAGATKRDLSGVLLELLCQES